MPAAQTLILVLLFFLLGTSNTIVTKVIFTLQGEGLNGTELFHKPAFGNWNMFFGMALVFIPYKYQQLNRRSALHMNVDTSKHALLDANESAQGSSFARQARLIAVPAIFDIVGTGLSLVGIILIPASVWQMLRGAEIIFAALLTITVLGRRLKGFHWFGVLLALIGICAVSASTILGTDVGNSSDSSEDNGSGTASRLVTIGVCITLLSQVVQAAQIIAEERLLVDLDMDELLVVGVEGLWGLLIMTCIVYPLLYFVIPGADNGHAEDPVDTYHMIKSSHAIQFFVVMDFLSCAVYNVLGQRITKEMSGMMRVMLEATRTMCVWMFNLGWHYLVDEKSMFGEAWNTWSYLEAVGFVFLILGQMTYGEKIHWPFFRYAPVSFFEEANTPLRASPKASLGLFASPKESTI